MPILAVADVAAKPGLDLVRWRIYETETRSAILWATT